MTRAQFQQHLYRLAKALRYGAYLAGGALARLSDPVHELRLRRRHARGEVTHVPCLQPFTRMEFLGRGTVSACCQAYTRMPAVGNMQLGSIEGIWNGAALRRFRRRLLLGESRRVCRPNCPHLGRAPLPIAELPEGSERERLLKEDLLAGRTRLRAWPATFELSNWGACNLRCVMCLNHTPAPMPRHVRRTYAGLQKYLDKEITLLLTGNGDPLARRDTRELLEGFDEARHPGVRFEILTNGLLWTAAAWERLRGRRFALINVSVDAATRETYEKIRRGGRWRTLLENFELLRREREAGRVGAVIINMTVMRSNYREIPEFVRLAQGFGFRAMFTRIRGCFGEENIFELNDREALEDLRRVLRDPAVDPAESDLIQLAEFLPGGGLENAECGIRNAE